MATVEVLIDDAAKQLAQLRAGQSLNDDEKAEGLKLFNRMVDTSNASRAFIFTEARNEFPTAAGKQTYTWGINGDWPQQRPERITQANFLLPTSPTVRRELHIWTRAQWASITFQQIYTYPEGFYCDYANQQPGSTPDSGLATLYFKPIPDAIYTLEFYSWMLNAQAAGLDTQISYPSGYEEFWLYNLSERLAPVLGLEGPTPYVADMARRTRATLMSKNLKAPRITTSEPGNDSGRRRGGFNWMSGLPL